MHKFLHRHFRHWFLPHEGNNYRAKILHHQTLIGLILLFAILGLLLPSYKQSHKAVLGISYNIPINDILTLTNQDRAANGLPPLTLNQTLNNAAAANAQYMFAKDYWAHFAPDGTSPWYFFQQAGYNYEYAGQNLARGFVNPTDLEQAWMASPEHRSNILSSHYTDVGFAVEEGTLTGEDTVLVVEMFGNQASSVAQQTDSSANANLALAPAAPTTAVTILPTLTPVITATPTAVPVIIAKSIGQKTITKKTANLQSSPLVDSATFAKNIAAIVIISILIALILDVLFIERKQVVRFVAHNLDHILFLGMLLLVILFFIGRGVTL